MRKRVYIPKDGDTRKRSGYLVFPKRIDDELRWLEYAEWEEKYTWCWYEGWWYSNKWLN
jgi:hypothetical protein